MDLRRSAWRAATAGRGSRHRRDAARQTDHRAVEVTRWPALRDVLASNCHGHGAPVGIQVQARLVARRCLFRLPDRIPPAVAMELALTGDFLDANGHISSA